MGSNVGRLSELKSNALTELGNIGAGNATTSLSKMLNTQINVKTPHVDIYDFNKLENVLGGPEKIVVGVLSQVEGSLKAMILFVIEVEDARNIIHRLVGDEVDLNDDMGLSVVTELANIIIGSYVASLETLCGMTLRYTLPEICIDMAGAVLSVPCSEFGKVSDHALLVNSSFETASIDINGYIMMLSEVDSFDVLLKKLGIGGADE